MLALYFKMNKKSVYFAFVFFFIYSVFTQPQLKSFDTKIKIKTEKKVYLTLEPIWISISVKNKDKTGPKMPRSSLHHYLYILNSKDKRIESLMTTFYGEISPMSSGELIEDVRDILPAFGSEGEILGRYLAPDIYRIKFLWRQGGYEPLFSNEIQVTVKEPTGEERNAVEVLEKGIEKRMEKNIEEADKDFYELVNVYPNSVYATRSLRYIMLNHAYREGIEHDEKRMLAAKMLLEKYPDNEYITECFHQIKYYYNKINDSEGLRNYLSKLAEITPDKELKEKIIEELKSL